MKTLLRTSLVLSALLAACSGDEAPRVVAPPKPPGLSAIPRWLTFSCVKPGCDTTLTVTLNQEGSRRLVIKRVVLSDPSRTDFSFTTPSAPPFAVEGSADITVRYVYKPGASSADVNLLVAYTDATADDGPDRVEPGEVTIPLLRRLIGEPVLVATPTRLPFTPTSVGAPVTRTITVENGGYGNIALDVKAIDSDSPEIAAGPLPLAAILPGETLSLPVIYSPTSVKFTKAKLTLRSSDAEVKPAEVIALATSLPGPRAATEPAAGLDFAEVPRHQAKNLPIEILNQGGAPLTLSSLKITGTPSDVSASLPGGVASVTLAPLESTTLTVALAAETRGPVDAKANLTTNDPSAPTLSIPIKGTVIEPEAKPTPSSVDFGNVFKGWTATRPITVENSGYGDLVVKAITLVHGSSELFSLRTLPILPTTLKRGEHLDMEVAFRADGEATFSGAVSVESNDPVKTFLQIPLKATGATCQTACPLAHATPSCTTGACAIGSCQTGWYDVNKTAGDGCECGDTNDNGPFCADAKDLGQVTKTHQGTATEYTGYLPVSGDVDTIRFATDDHGLFAGHTVFIDLYSTDPTIKMCAFWRKGSDCPSDTDENACGAHLQTTEEGHTFLLKISRTPGAAPTCVKYTVTVTHP